MEHGDSAKLAAYHNTRIRRNKVLQGLAQRDPTAMGWFFGFKLHQPIQHQGQTMALKTAALRGKVVGDRGTIAKSP